MSYIIYCHKNKINNKVYIGQTKQSIEKRWGKNGCNYTKDLNSYFGKAIKKYGWNNFEHLILFTHLTQEEANQKEIELITFYDSTNPDKGYNITNGGNNANTLSDEQKELLRQRNLTLWQNGFFTDIINTPVYCIELNITFESALEAERQTGIDNSSIQKVCKKQQHYAGYMPDGQPIHWIYLSEKTPSVIKELLNKKEIIKGVSIPLYSPELNEFFNSAAEVEQKYHISATNIRACIKGKQKTAGKHPITKTPLHWIERLDLIDTKNKLSQSKVKELLQ